MLREWLRRLWLVSPVAVRRWLVARVETRLTVAVIGVLQDPEGRVLLLRHFWHVHGGWALPGGFLKRAEAPEEGLARELREETRLHCDQLRLKLARSVAGGQGLELVFHGRIDNPQPLQLNPEILEACWASPAALPESMPVGQRRAIRDVLGEPGSIKGSGD